MKREQAFGYARISSKNQLNGSGHDRQEEAIKAFARRNGFEISKIFKDEISGTKDEEDRPAFQEMISEILKDGTNTIVVSSLDRLARGYSIQEHLIIYIASRNIDLYASDTGENITKAFYDDPMKRALIQIQSTFSELDKALLIRKLRKARERIRDRYGKCEGRLGYYQIDPALIKRIKQLRRKPRKGRRLTLAKIAETIASEGFETMTGTEWKGRIIQDILRNEEARAKARAKRKAKAKAKKKKRS